MRRSFSSLMKNQNNLLTHECEAIVSLVEQIVSLEVEKAYAELKALFNVGGKDVVLATGGHFYVGL